MPADPTNGRGDVLPAEPQQGEGQQVTIHLVPIYDHLPNGAAENRPPQPTKPTLHIFLNRRFT